MSTRLPAPLITTSMYSAGYDRLKRTAYMLFNTVPYTDSVRRGQQKICRNISATSRISEARTLIELALVMGVTPQTISTYRLCPSTYEALVMVCKAHNLDIPEYIEQPYWEDML